MLPNHVSKELKDRSTLWNSVELNEKAINAKLARNFIIALPKELSLEENKALITDFIQENFVSKGMIVDLPIHDENNEGNNNIHAHIMTTVRPINDKGEWRAKSKKEYVLDEQGNQVFNKNGKPKTRKAELTDWNDKGNAEKWRESFSILYNQYLEKNNIEKRVDHRSYERQGKEEIPTIHLGASISALERKGVITDKGNINREIRKHNSLVKDIKKNIAGLTSWISDFKNRLFLKYEKYKQEKKDEYENKAEFFNLREYISIYHDMQVEKRQGLNAYASQKKGVYDLEKFASAISYLSTNQLTTIADLQEQIESLQSQYRKINKEIKINTIKIENLNKCLVYAEIIKDNKPIYDKWESKKLFKDSFYQSHKEEIDKYQRAMIQKATGSSAIKAKDWQREIKGCEDEITKLNKQSELIKNEYQRLIRQSR